MIPLTLSDPSQSTQAELKYHIHHPAAGARCSYTENQENTFNLTFILSRVSSNQSFSIKGDRRERAFKNPLSPTE